MLSFLKMMLTPEFFFSIIRISAPILFATLGAIVVEKAGFCNIGLEGTMMFAALAGSLVSYYASSWAWGLLAALVTGTLLALMMGFFAFQLKTDITMAGIAVNMMGSGGTLFLCKVITNLTEGKAMASSTGLITSTLCIPNITIPLLNKIPFLGGILSGIFTPTEASIVTCVYSLIVGVFVYKEIKLSDVPRIVYTNMRSCSSIIILIGLANVFAFILTNERIPQKVATAILSITTNRVLVILLINLVLIFVGMFMESLAAILITFPVLLPVATAVGMNPVHFALMAILNLMIGLTTPPVGMCICTGAQIGGVSSWKAFKANMPFLITSLVVLMLVSFCEPITLWIPSLFA